MLILGIDPGTATTGFGVVEIVGDALVPVKYGLIETSKEKTPEKRLHAIHEQLTFLISKYKPHHMCIEKVFFATNAKTAIRVGQAQGVMLLAAANYNLPVYEYAPGTIKKYVAGHGRADKEMMQEGVRKFLGGKIISKKNKKTHFDNEADALAVALCHIISCDDIDTPWLEEAKATKTKK